MEYNMKYCQYRRHTERQNVAVVGGILGLVPQYRRILEECHFNSRIYNRVGSNLSARVASTDLIILFAGTVSHKMAKEVRKSTIANDVPLVTIIPSSLNALRNFVFRICRNGKSVSSSSMRSFRDIAQNTIIPIDNLVYIIFKQNVWMNPAVCPPGN